MRKRVANSLNSRDVCNASTPGFKPTPPKNKRKQQLFFFSFSLWVFLFRFALIRGKALRFDSTQSGLHWCHNRKDEKPTNWGRRTGLLVPFKNRGLASEVGELDVAALGGLASGVGEFPKNASK
ncbi:hypothetical protein D0Y65_022288 [Glycine soja]|uniref:Uncharacterized protein n=1 Tax=Glycine soja TaxID=3848 RepID=A0A445JN12_GLYSO|nr:hypothetical protein D0Y65_022288 [Glycine soja]